MTIINCDKINLSYGVKDVLCDVNFALNSGDRLGIVGVNGAGKTSLMNIITGQPDMDFSGSVNISRGVTVGALSQRDPIPEGITLYNAVASVYEPLRELKEQIKATEQAIAEYSPEGNESAESLRLLLDDHDLLTARFTESGGYEYESRMRSALISMGFPEESWHRLTETLSGGQKTRAALIMLFLREPDILMLDEPTNHVDITGLEWLENYLSSYRKTIITVSHDRFFLDRVCTKILELEYGKSTMYNGNYTSYVQQKEKNQAGAAHRYTMQQREIARIESIIEQQRRWGREKNIKTAESKQKQIDRMIKLDKPERPPEKIRLSFGNESKSGVSGNDVLSVRSLMKSYPGKPLFSDLSFEIKRGDRFFIIGGNGTGKSTLMKILTERITADSGEFSFGYNVIPGYYDQERQELDDNNTVLGELWDEYGDMRMTDIRNALALFLFRGDDTKKSVAVLSGGERARLTFAKLMLARTNLLLLDEPTNHLDIGSREALESALSDYKGTIIAVSHDRYFINKLAGRILELSENRNFLYNGTYADYITYKKSHLTRPEIIRPEPVSPVVSDYNRAKAEKRERDKLLRKHKKIEDEIIAAEERSALIEEMSTDEKYASDYEKLQEFHTEQEQILIRLEELYTELTGIDSALQNM